VLFYVLFVLIVLFCLLFVCKSVLYYCQRVSTQLQLNILYNFITSASLQTGMYNIACYTFVVLFLHSELYTA